MKKILSMLALSCLPLTSQAATLDTEQQDQVRQLIRQTLVDNPDIIVEAIDALRVQEFKAQQRQEKTALQDNQAALFENKADPFIGAEKPALTIAYFTDYNCGFCKRQNPVIAQIIKAFPQVRIVYKDFPVLGDSSRDAAVMALTAFKSNPDSYVPLHDKLMSKPGGHNTQSIESAVKATGLSVDVMKTGRVAEANQQINQNLQLARKLGIQGTPALIFPDTAVRGYTEFAALEKLIKKHLDKDA